MMIALMVYLVDPNFENRKDDVGDDNDERKQYLLNYQAHEVVNRQIEEYNNQASEEEKQYKYVSLKDMNWAWLYETTLDGKTQWI